MGLSAAKMLSAKGANIIIVARNQQRLDEALKQISVSRRNMPFPFLSLSFTPVRNNQSVRKDKKISTIELSLHFLRLQQ